MEQARTNGNVQLWTSHMMMILGGGLFGGGVLPAQYCPCDFHLRPIESSNGVTAIFLTRPEVTIGNEMHAFAGGCALD